MTAGVLLTEAQLGRLNNVLHVIDVDGIESAISLDRGEDPRGHFLLALIVSLSVADVGQVRVAGSQRDRSAVGCVDVAIVEVVAADIERRPTASARTYRSLPGSIMVVSPSVASMMLVRMSAEPGGPAKT